MCARSCMYWHFLVPVHCKLTWSRSGLGSSIFGSSLGLSLDLLLLFLLLLDALTTFGGQRRKGGSSGTARRRRVNAAVGISPAILASTAIVSVAAATGAGSDAAVAVSSATTAAAAAAPPLAVIVAISSIPGRPATTTSSSGNAGHTPAGGGAKLLPHLAGLLPLLADALVVSEDLDELLGLLPHPDAAVDGALVVVEAVKAAEGVGVVPGVVDASLGAVLDEMLEEGQALEDDAPRGRTLGFQGLPHDAGDDRDCILGGNVLLGEKERKYMNG